MLFPQRNTARWFSALDGFWRFRPDPEDAGLADGWATRPLPEPIAIAVPGAWNEQLAERGLLDHVGVGWYETDLALPRRLSAGQRLWLRFGAACHAARVWLDGVELGAHQGGFLPFAVELTGAWRAGESHRLSVCVDSRLGPATLPQDLDPATPPFDHPSYRLRLTHPPTRFDFHPWGGLIRPVHLVSTPPVLIDSVRVTARIDGTLEIRARLDGDSAARHRLRLEVRDREGGLGATVETDVGADGRARLAARIPNPRLWSPADPHLYVAALRLFGAAGEEIDRYDQSFGVREVTVAGAKLQLNGEPLFLVGCGRHEDLPVVGSASAPAFTLRDFELLRWLGANSFRTSHYPYGEDVMHLADRLGFLVLDEVPAVSLGFSPPPETLEDLRPLLERHCRELDELIDRDAHHPSVVAWSVVNEANLWAEPGYVCDAARDYFRALYAHARRRDPSRPVLAITMRGHGAEDPALAGCDLIGLNRYYGWYHDLGDLADARRRLAAEMAEIHARWRKPVILTEVGADAVAGLHATTPQLFTEEYQRDLLTGVLDLASTLPWCAGVHVWNLADFRTPQHHRRVQLNRKGLFTRDREPKAAAFAVRRAFLAEERLTAAQRPESGEERWAPRACATLDPRSGAAV